MIRRLGFILLVVALAAAQDRPTFRIKVDLVVLSFTITDNKGHYVNGLKPSDFRILEDGIPQKLTTFSEGNKPPVEVAADGTFKPIVVDAARSRRHRPRHGNALGCVRRNERLRAVRHQQLYVSRLRLRLGRHRRFHPRSGSRRFGGGVHLLPQFDARGASSARSATSPSADCGTRWRATIRRSTTRCC